MRRPPPYEGPYRRGSQNEEENKDRLVVAQIHSIDTKNGLATVRTSAGEEYTVQIPMKLSVQGRKSSWQRYMPQTWDSLKVDFTRENTPEAVAHAAPGEETTSTQGALRQGRYANVAKMAADDLEGFGKIWRELKEGEWDMRSCGGAEIYGDRFGTLSLAGGGGAAIALDKNREEFRTRTRLSIFTHDGVEVRFGNVKRRIPPAIYSETEPVAPNPGAFPSVPGVASTLREFSVSVGWPTPPLGTPKLTYWDMSAGTPTDSLGLPEVAVPSVLPAATQVVPFPPNPLRYRARFYPIAGLIPNLRVEVDALGNVQVEQLPAAAVGISVTAARLFLHANTTTACLASNLATRGVLLGSENASQAMVLGTSWALERAAMHAEMVAQHARVAQANTTLATAAAALGVAATQSAGELTHTSLAIAVGAFATALAAAATNVATAEAALAAAIRKFETGTGAGQAAAAGTSYVSLKVFGDP